MTKKVTNMTIKTSKKPRKCFETFLHSQKVRLRQNLKNCHGENTQKRRESR